MQESTHILIGSLINSHKMNMVISQRDQETTVRCCITHTRMSTTTTTMRNRKSRMQGTSDPDTQVGVQNGAVIVDSSLAFPQKVKY